MNLERALDPEMVVDLQDPLKALPVSCGVKRMGVSPAGSHDGRLGLGL